MIKRLTTLRSIILSLLVLIAILPIQEAFAQWGGTQGSGIPGMPGMRRGAGRNASNPDGSSSSQIQPRAVTPSPGSHLLTYEQIETSLSQLEDSLHLSSEESKAWNAFAGKVRLYASDVAKERARLNSDTNTSSDGLKYLTQASEDAKSRYNSLKEVEDSAKPLYKTLNAEQKGVFDKKVPSFIATTPKSIGSSLQNYNLPDLGSSAPQSQKQGSNSLPGYIHQ
jgi:hypothetical protein